MSNNPAWPRIALPGHHRFKWLYVTAFVAPATGETVWYLSNGVSKPFFEGLLHAFAREVGAGPDKRVILVLDNAGWHTLSNLNVPDGLRLIYLPPYSPELQPAETLWPIVDEPIVNTYIANLEDLEPRRQALPLPCPTARHHQVSYLVPLVAQNHKTELINRKSCQHARTCLAHHHGRGLGLRGPGSSVDRGPSHRVHDGPVRAAPRRAECGDEVWRDAVAAGVRAESVPKTGQKTAQRRLNKAR